MSCILRKPVFGVSDQIRHKPDCTAAEDSQRLEILDLGSRGIVLSIKRKRRRWAVTAQLICAFVFAYAKSRFSHDAAHMNELQLDWAFYCQIMHFGAIIQ